MRSVGGSSPVPLGLKLVVSTTSVMPSNGRARLPTTGDGLREMRTPIERNDANVVVRLGDNNDVSGRLRDLRLRGHPAGNSGGPPFPVMQRVYKPGDVTSAPLARAARRPPPVASAPQALGGESTIRRINNQRRAQVRSDATLPGVHPYSFQS